ncbi:hypothetical protein [uncultured Modestobacter sp.]|uniref:hypothetical protein n=1 Tax=uncultured Modestobacter sp. TaxID=380048 RepID=UPI002637AC8A|nr:hypothetical protein [uncultured Modestobacter sp.]
MNGPLADDACQEDLVEGLVFALQSVDAIGLSPLPLSALVAEIEEWAVSARDDPWRRARASLREEVNATLRVVGSTLRASVAEPLSRYVEAFEAIASAKPRDAETVADIRRSASALVEALSTPVSLEASWRDMEKAVASDDLFAAVAAASQLKGQLSLGGRDSKEVLADLLRILRRDAWSVDLAMRRLDGGTARPWRELAEAATADVAAEDLRNLACRTLIEPGREGHVVVWSLYDHAITLQGITSLGPLTILLPQWIVEVAFGGSGHELPLAEEVRKLSEEVRKLWRAESDRDEGYDYTQHVLIRVDLGVRSPVGGLDAAADLIETLMDALLSIGSDSRWGKAVWSTMLVDGEEQASRFGRGSRRSDFADSMGMEATWDALNVDAEGFARALVARPVPWHLREALRISAEASHATSRAVALYDEWHNDDRTVLLLLDSAFEHVAALAGTEASLLSKKLSDLWPAARGRRLILWAIDSCLHRRQTGKSRPEDAVALERMIKAKTGHRRGTSLLVAYRSIDRLTALAGSRLQRAVVHRVVGQLGDARLHALESDRLSEDAQLAISRQRRVRNALTHGNPVTRFVLASVVDYSRFRTGVAVRAALDSYADGVAMNDYLRDKEQERATDTEEMRRGRSQIDIWEAEMPEAIGE